MSKITIIEGNSNDKDNVRNFMVKGEPGNDGFSPTVSVERGTNSATVNVTDAEGTKSVVINDGFSPTVTASKVEKTTTITMTDIDGTRTAEIKDGVDLTGGVPTNGVIGWDGTEENIPNGYEVSPTSFATITDSYSTSTSDGYSANYINNALIDTYSTIETKTNKVWIDGKPIYRKVFDITDSSDLTTGEHTSNLGITTLDKITNLKSTFLRTALGGLWETAPKKGDIYCVDIYDIKKASGNFTYNIGTGLVDMTELIIIFEYTKTTD